MQPPVGGGAYLTHVAPRAMLRDMAKRQLHAPNGVVTVREAVAAADAATWTPEDVADTVPGVTRDLVILDGEYWDEVAVTPRFSTPHATDACSIQALIAVPQAAAPGRQWVAVDAATAITAAAHGKGIRLRNDGHDVAFRVTGVTIGTALGTIDIIATGGRRRSSEP